MFRDGTVSYRILLDCVSVSAAFDVDARLPRDRVSLVTNTGLLKRYAPPDTGIPCERDWRINRQCPLN